MILKLGVKYRGMELYNLTKYMTLSLDDFFTARSTQLPLQLNGKSRKMSFDGNNLQGIDK